MLGTIRTIQHQAGQALPTCARSNHNLMNTFGAVCSKLLPVGAEATGNTPPPHPITLCPLSLHLGSIATASPSLLILAPAVRPSTLALNQIKIQTYCEHSDAAASTGALAARGLGGGVCAVESRGVCRASRPCRGSCWRRTRRKGPSGVTVNTLLTTSGSSELLQKTSFTCFAGYFSCNWCLRHIRSVLYVDVLFMN